MLNAECWRLLGLVQTLQFLPRAPRERQSPRHHLVQHHPKGIDVRPHVNSLGVIELLWGHVRGCPSRHPCVSKTQAQALRVKRLGVRPASIKEHSHQTEVSHLQRAILGNQAVLRLDVAMRLDSLRPRVSHPVAKMNGKAQYLRWVFGQSQRTYPAAQVTAADIFEKEVRLACDVLDEAGLSDILVGIKIDPGEYLMCEAVCNIRREREDFILKSLGSVHIIVFMIIDNVDDAHATAQDPVDFPAVLYQVPYLPSGCH